MCSFFISFIAEMRKILFIVVSREGRDLKETSFVCFFDESADGYVGISDNV